MYVVTVRFVLRPEHAGAFRQALARRTEALLETEPGCLRLDCWEDPAAPHEVTLYGIFETEGDFEAILASDRSRHFQTEVAPWVLERHVETLPPVADRAAATGLRSR